MKTQLQRCGRVGFFRLSGLTLILTALLVCALLALFYLRERARVDALAELAAASDDARDAFFDAFILMNPADGDLPGPEKIGSALEQLRGLPARTRRDGPGFDAQAADLERALAAFTPCYAGWVSAGRPPQGAEASAFRSASHVLGQRIDAQADGVREHYHWRAARLDHAASATAIVSIVLLAALCAGVYRAGHRHAAAIASLRQNEALLRALTDNLPGCYLYQFEHEPGGQPRFLFASAGIERVHGVTAEAALADATSITGQMDEEMAAAYPALAEKSRVELGEFRLEGRIRLPDGTERWIRVQSLPMRMPGGATRWDGFVVDITEARRTQRELEESRARLDLFAQATFEAILTVRDGVIVDGNEQAARLFRTPLPELKGRTVASFLPPEECERVLPNILANLPSSIEHSLALPDGSRIEVEVRGRPLPGSGGLRQAVLRDITGLREAERMRTRYHLLAQHARDPMLLIAKDGRLLEANAAAARFYGCSLEELRTLHVFDLRPTDDLADIRGQMETAGRQGLLFETKHRRRDGTVVEVEVSACAVQFDGEERLLSVVRDITERKRAEAALRTNAARQRAILDNIPDAAWLHDSEGRIVDVNKAWCDQLGVAKADVLGRTVRELMPPAVAERMTLIDEAVRATGKAQQLEQSVPVKAGLRHFETNIAPLLDESGRVIGTTGIARDISERMRNERALRESLLFRREAERIAGIGAWKVNPVTDFLYWTEGVYEIVELPLDYKPGLEEGLALYDAESIPALRAAIVQALLHGTPFVLEVGLTTGKGRHIWTEVRGLGRVGEGEQSFVMGTFQDITERRRMTEETNRLARAVEQAAGAIMITDVQSRLVYVNPAFERLTGYSRSEVMGRNPRFLKGGEADPGLYESMWKTLSRGEVWTGHLINRRKDGTLFEEEAVISPVRNTAGVVTNYVAAKHDVTREKQLEAQVVQSQKMEAVGRLAGGVAHDINNIVQAIYGFCDILLEKLPPEMPARSEVEEVRKSAGRAAGLTRQLLAFSRRQLITPAVLDLNQIVADTQNMLVRLLGEDIRIVNRFDANLPSINADAGNMEQVIMNLAVNARDAMPAGGTITFSTTVVEPGAAELASHADARPGRFVCLSVEDTGSGMSPEILRHLFEPFYSTKGPEKGTGLGLSVIYGIVRQHGGWIDVSSEEGRGSVFRVHLPVHEVVSPVALPAASTPPVPPRGGGERILLLEDDPVVRDVVTRFLRMAGYEILVARNAAEAREIFAREKQRLDVLFTDVVLPDGNGFDIAGEFRAIRRDLVIVLSSGYTDERARWGDTQASGYHYLQKPYLAADLLEAMRKALAAGAG